ncbi:hypothetical protein Q0Z83_088430 [Actinoplanes sichuanensis]|uniref:Uncharacterized protein n=1 Tax=Actinoplanes sichuanensis TaxID=512349 RepID=A0ABW4A356_9ACTN|nr:hypothetical protein [Actinoplanes sichuanensis]BEL10652.1 hypothetical protein Q0Z83_088430 [Actinoplanes sichuanensis]
MSAVRNRVLAALLAVAPAAGLLIGAPVQAADSDIVIKSVSVSRDTVVLGSRAGCATVTFTAVLSAPIPAGSPAPSGVRVDIEGPLSQDGYLRGRSLTQVGSSTTYRATLPLCGTDRSGRYLAVVSGGVYTGPGQATYIDPEFIDVFIKRPSRLTLNASPEPVRKGRKITAKGILKVDGKGYAAARVKVFFKANGASTWTYKGTAVTNAKGVYGKRFTAVRSGVWKAVYEGDLKREPAAAGDAVKVG